MVFGDNTPSSNAKNLHDRITTLENKKIEITSIPTSTIIDKIQKGINNDSLATGAVLTYEGFKQIEDLEKDNNCKVISAYGRAKGQNTKAGTRGYTLQAGDIDLINNTIRIRNADVTEGVYAKGDIVTILWNHEFDNHAVIEDMYIEMQEGTEQPDSIIQVDFLNPHMENVDKEPEAGTKFPNGYIFVAAKPNYGNADIGIGARAIGQDNHAVGNNSFACGRNNIALGSNSLVGGIDSRADYCSYAVGRACQAIGKYAHAEGRATIAGTNTTDVGHAEGNSSRALGEAAHAEGHTSLAQGFYTHAEGNATIAYGRAAHAEGQSTSGLKVQDTILAKIKEFTETYTGYAIEDQLVNYWRNLAPGSRFGIAFGAQSHIEGINCIASGTRSHAEGYETIAKRGNSHAEGEFTEALDWSAHAEGKYTQAIGSYSHAEGGGVLDNGSEESYTFVLDDKTITLMGSVARGKCSHAEGTHTYAYGLGAHAEGGRSIVKGKYAHAEGCITKAIANMSHAEGYNTEASGESSHAEGVNTIASGGYAHAEGQGCQALKWETHAEGTGTIAYQNSQHVQGKYNAQPTDTTYAHIVGWGSSDSDRKNIHTLTTSGNAWFAGDVSATSFTLNGTTITSWPSGDNGSDSSYVEGEGISINSNIISLEAATADSLGGIKISFNNGILTIST